LNALFFVQIKQCQICLHVITNANFSYPFQPSKSMQGKNAYILYVKFYQTCSNQKGCESAGSLFPSSPMNGHSA